MHLKCDCLQCRLSVRDGISLPDFSFFQVQTCEEQQTPRYCAIYNRDSFGRGGAGGHDICVIHDMGVLRAGALAP